MRKFSLKMASTLLLAGTASAQTPADLSRVETEQRLREAESAAAQVQATALRRDLAALDAELAELLAAEARGEAGVSAKRLRLASLSAREGDLARRVEANRETLSRLLGVLARFSRDRPPALIVHPKDVRDAVRAAILARALTPELERRADGYAQEAQDLRLVRREAAAQSEDLFTAESGLADEVARLEAAIVEKRALERRLAADAIISGRQAQTLAVQARTLRELVGALPAARAPASGQGLPTRLLEPVAAAPLRRFGERQLDGGRSQGWAWTATGETVKAPAGGVVEYVGSLRGLGTVLILRPAQGHHLVLTGLDLSIVSLGQSVAQGQIVGRMAKETGSGVGSSVPELRLEVRKDGEPVDPARYFGGGALAPTPNKTKSAGGAPR